MSLFPKILCDPNRIDLQVFPPSHFITRLMQLPVMAAAKRYGELIADFQANGARLGKPHGPAAPRNLCRKSHLRRKICTQDISGLLGHVVALQASLAGPADPAAAFGTIK